MHLLFNLDRVASAPRIPGVRQPHRYARRGNAMMLAVSISVMLAIIGSSFVIMSRLDRQAVVGVETEQLLIDARNRTVETIQKVLEQDIVGSEPFTDLNGNGRVDPGEFTDQNGNTLYDDVMLLDNGGQTSSLTSREPYDWAGWSNPANPPEDPWLSSIEPNVADFSITPLAPTWVKPSEIWPNITPTPLQAGLVDPSSPAVANVPADADGDGIVDSWWRVVPGLSSEGKIVLAAVRIIDNCGMVNVNTTWQRSNNTVEPHSMLARSVGPSAANSFGEFPHQINLEFLLNTRTHTRINGHDGLNIWTGLGAITGRQDTLINNHSQFFGTYDLNSLWFHRVNSTFHEMAGLLTGIGVYGLDDEFELRNRFILNTRSSTWLEKNMVETIGNYDPANPVADYRSSLLKVDPTNPAMDTPEEVVDAWARQIYDANPTQSSADQRHLLTTYSYDRSVRLKPISLAPSTAVENIRVPVHNLVPNSANLPARGLRWRQLDINEAMRNLWRSVTIPADITYRLDPSLQTFVMGFMASGRGGSVTRASLFDADDAVQYLANLIDYIDREEESVSGDPLGIPTIIPADWILPGIPSRPIVGTERQPFITEVFHAVSTVDGTTFASNDFAIELYNPDDQPIDLRNWRIDFNGATLFDLGTTLPSGPPPGLLLPSYYLQPRERRVYYDAAGTLAQNLIANRDQFNERPPTAVPATLANRPIAPAGTTGIPIQLVRNVTHPTFGPFDILIDVVPATEVDDYLNVATVGAPRYNAIWREAGQFMSTRYTRRSSPEIQPLLADADPYSVVGIGTEVHLGRTRKIVPIPDAVPAARTPGGVPAGITFHIADRYVPTFSDVQNGNVWVAGWEEIGQVLWVGNPSLVNYAPFAPNPVRTITEHGRAFGVNREYFRIDLGNALYGGQFLDIFSLVTRTWDNFDNDNEDEDFFRTAGATWESDMVANLNPTTPGVGNQTNANDLRELRIPGRINVNTAPYHVLRSLVPALLEPDTGKRLNSGQLRDLSDRMAREIIAGRPYTSLSKVVQRFVYSAADTFSEWYMYDSGAASRAGFDWRTTQVTNPEISPAWPLASRNWIIARMLNMMTVRSDTFTAYVAVRVADQANPSEYSERREIVLFDRSNVFLPEQAGRNGRTLFRDLDEDSILNDQRGSEEPWAETFTDLNGDGVYTPSEPFFDLNGSGYTDGIDLWLWDWGRDGVPDTNDSGEGNGTYDAGEPYLDLGPDGLDFGEPFLDLSGNPPARPGEPSTPDQQWTPGDSFVSYLTDPNCAATNSCDDLNYNGIHDLDESGEMAIFDAFLSINGRSIWPPTYQRDDPDAYDRKYTTTRIVGVRSVPETR